MFITTEKVAELFLYGDLRKVMGASLSQHHFKSVGNHIGWKSKKNFYKGYKDIPACDIPPHIQWSNNPIFAYVGFVDDKIEYRYGDQHGSSIYHMCPITTDENEISMINDIFQYWYNHFDLPHSLSKDQKNTIDRSNPEKLIANYLDTGSTESFNILVEKNDVAFAVDWREEDDAIINNCEKIIKTGSLSAELHPTKDAIGFEILIAYKGKKTKIQYSKDKADRDTTIITLNEILHPEYEIRLCEMFKGGDTLIFMPLSSKKWAQLDKKYGKVNVEKHFSTISKKTKMFG